MSDEIEAHQPVEESGGHLDPAKLRQTTAGPQERGSATRSLEQENAARLLEYETKKKERPPVRPFYNNNYYSDDDPSGY